LTVSRKGGKNEGGRLGQFRPSYRGKRKDQDQPSSVAEPKRKEEPTPSKPRQPKKKNRGAATHGQERPPGRCPESTNKRRGARARHGEHGEEKKERRERKKETRHCGDLPAESKRGGPSGGGGKKTARILSRITRGRETRENRGEELNVFHVAQGKKIH